MRNQVTTLQGHPPDEVRFRVSEETQNTPLVAVNDRSPTFCASANGRAGDAVGRSIHNILVPTDFSPSSAVAVERAVALARQSDASLTILHVIDINPRSGPTHCGTAEDLMRQLWLTATSELPRLKQSFGQAQVRIRTMAVEGLPYEAIVESSSGFDLLVIREPHPQSRWNFFSKQTARRVIEQAKCPVHVVRQETSKAARNPRSKAKAKVTSARGTERCLPRESLAKRASDPLRPR